MAKKDKTSQHLIFFSLLDSVGIKRPKPEVQFHPTRKWRFDYAWPDQKIALEVEGGAFIGGRHTSGAGFIQDMEKYNAAGVLGWRIFKVVPKELCRTATIDLLKQIIIYKP